MPKNASQPSRPLCHAQPTVLPTVRALCDCGWTVSDTQLMQNISLYIRMASTKIENLKARLSLQSVVPIILSCSPIFSLSSLTRSFLTHFFQNKISAWSSRPVFEGTRVWPPYEIQEECLRDSSLRTLFPASFCTNCGSSCHIPDHCKRHVQLCNKCHGEHFVSVRNSLFDHFLSFSAPCFFCCPPSDRFLL